MKEDGFIPDEPPLTSTTVQAPFVYVSEDVVWEYKHIVRNLEREEAPSEEHLNILGAEGWELVAILAELPYVHFYFKRMA